MTILFMLLGGLAVLTAGAELLVRGASTLASRFGIPALIIGLTVVAFGTSAPEMAVSIRSALTGQADLALGNVVGSNTFNVLFILGASALIIPLSVSVQLIRIDVPIMVGVSLLMWLVAADGMVMRWEGGLLLLGILVYTGLQIRLGFGGGGAEATNDAVPAKPRGAMLFDLALVFGGLLLLVLGARWFIDGAVKAARLMGVDELLIGLTLVAAGTSLPEVAASIMAAVRGERDIAVGNVVGSNIFNILAVLGGSAVASGQGLPVAPAALAVDIPIMVIVACLCLPIFLSGRIIDRWEGGLLLAAYAAYVVLLAALADGTPTAVDTGGWLTRVLLPLAVLWTLWQLFRARPDRSP